MPGADWIRLGGDGLRRQDLRAALRTADGEIILMRYDTALIRESPEFLNALRDGGKTQFSDQYMRMVPEFETGAPNYSWPTSSLFLAEGRLAGPRRIEYVVYRVE